MKVEFSFEGSCRIHLHYDPSTDGRRGDCPGCETLYVIWLYSGIARRRAEKAEGIIAADR